MQLATLLLTTAVPNPRHPDGLHRADYRAADGFKLERLADGAFRIEHTGRAVFTSVPGTWTVAPAPAAPPAQPKPSAPARRQGGK